MSETNHSVIIVMADDDEDDRMMIQEAFEELHLVNDIHFVEDGEELLKYLYRQEPYTEFVNTPLPGLILLDLNMPKKDGREALKAIKTNPELSHIPVVVLTTSTAQEDIACTYASGANSFIVKPVSFESLMNIVQGLMTYWFDIVELPPHGPVNIHNKTAAAYERPLERTIQ